MSYVTVTSYCHTSHTTKNIVEGFRIIIINKILTGCDT